MQRERASEDTSSERKAQPRKKASQAGPKKTPPGALSPYDDLVKTAAKKGSVDWRLVVAIMKEESGFDPQAETAFGKGGLLGLPPRLARRYGARRVTDPKTGIRAGVRYLEALTERFRAVSVDERTPVVLAAFKVGAGHVTDARRVAVERELSGDRWKGHIEKGLRALSDPRVAAHTRFGFCRGAEAADWVDRVMATYASYQAKAANSSAPKSR